jgi:RNA polymerase sigma-70 factor (ECF subfamily)
MGADGATTSPTLLAKVRDYENREAWERFLSQYEPLIRGWCRRFGVRGADADEVSAMVLLKLGQRMRSFTYDPSRRFRAWLRTVVNSQVKEFFSRAARPGGDTSGSDQLAQLADPTAAADALCQQLEEERRQRGLLDVALELVRQRVEPQTWQAFALTALEDGKGADVAARLGIKLNAVYKARSRVIQLLEQEVDRLQQAQAESL